MEPRSKGEPRTTNTRQIIIHICTNEMHNNKYTVKGTPLTTHNKTIFLFEFPMVRRTIYSYSGTSKEVISIKALQ